MNNTNKRISNLNKRIDQILKNNRRTINKSRPRSAPVANGATSSSRNQASANRYRVRQTERFSVILANGSSGYSVTSISINPGVSFPWLTNIAKGYDKYHLYNLRFTFKTSQPTLTAGTVGLGFDYNPLDGSPSSSTQFSQLTTWNIQSVWKNFSMTIDTSRQLLNYLFVRTGLLGGSDLKTYDIGKLHIMFEGIPITINPGETLGYIEATYDVELIDKQPVSVLADYSQGLISVATDLGGNTSTAPSSGTVVLTSAPKDWKVNNLDLPVVGNSTNPFGHGSTFALALTSYLVTRQCAPIILEKGIYNVDIGTKTVTNLTVNGLVDADNNDLIASNSAGSIIGTLVVDDAKAIYVKATASGTVSSTDLQTYLNGMKIVVQKI